MKYLWIKILFALVWNISKYVIDEMKSDRSCGKIEFKFQCLSGTICKPAGLVYTVELSNYMHVLFILQDI